MVGNDNKIECHQICTNVLVNVQSHMFAMNLHVLTRSEAHIILEVQWLKALGPILIDNKDLTIKSFIDGEMIELDGDHDNEIHLIMTQ